MKSEGAESLCLRRSILILMSGILILVVVIGIQRKS